MILIDTNGGNEKLPAWSHNLKAKPEAEVEIGRRRLDVSARVAEGAEREELWRACNRQYEGFDDYVRWLDRTPSVWVLEPVGTVAHTAPADVA
jgi:deazaflavin-dependent oxidoreductase (nitroreductase family)